MTTKLSGRELYNSLGGAKFAAKLGLMNLSIDNSQVEFNIGPNKSGAFSVQIKQNDSNALDVAFSKYNGRLFKMIVLHRFDNLTTQELLTTLEDTIGMKF